MDEGSRDIWKATFDGSDTPLTEGGLAADGPADVRWSPDGTRIAFISDVNGMNKVWTVPAAGGKPTPVSTTPGEDVSMGWSPDGRRLAIASRSPEDDGESDIWIVSLAGGKPERVVSQPGVDTQPHWSPDGSRICFASDRPLAEADVEQGEKAWNIWTVPAEGGEPAWFAEGHSPQWSPDGTEVLHVWDGDICTIPTSGGVPTTLLAFSRHGARPRWSPDGDRILYGARPPGHDEPDVWIIDVGELLASSPAQ